MVGMSRGLKIETGEDQRAGKCLYHPKEMQMAATWESSLGALLPEKYYRKG